MEARSSRPTLSKLYQSSESKRNTAYDALAEEFEDDYSRLMKELIEIINLINPTRANKYRLRKLVIEYGYKCESLEDLKMCLNSLKLWDNCDETDTENKLNMKKDVVDCGCKSSENSIDENK